MKHGGTTRVEKKWNKERNERMQEMKHGVTTRGEKKWNKERNENKK